MSVPAPHVQRILAQHHLDQLRGELTADLKLWQALESGVAEPGEQALEWRRFLAGPAPETLLSIWLSTGVVASDWAASAGQSRPGPLRLHSMLSLSAAILLAPEWLRRSPTLLERVGQTPFEALDETPAGPRQHLHRRLSAAPMVSLISAMVVAGDDLTPIWQRVLDKDTAMNPLVQMNGSARWTGELPETEAEILLRWIGNLEFNTPPVCRPSPAWREAVRPLLIACPENQYLDQNGRLAVHFAPQLPPCSSLSELIVTLVNHRGQPRFNRGHWLVSSNGTILLITGSAGRLPAGIAHPPALHDTHLLNTELIFNLLRPLPGEQPLPLWMSEAATRISSWLIYADGWLSAQNLGDLISSGHKHWPTYRREELVTHLRRRHRPEEGDLIHLQALLSVHKALNDEASTDPLKRFARQTLGEIITTFDRNPHSAGLLDAARLNR